MSLSKATHLLISYFFFNGDKPQLHRILQAVHISMQASTVSNQSRAFWNLTRIRCLLCHHHEKQHHYNYHCYHFCIIITALTIITITVNIIITFIIVLTIIIVLEWFSVVRDWRIMTNWLVVERNKRETRRASQDYVCHTIN